MRTKQNYREKITQEQNNTSHFEKDEFDSSNSDSSESSTSHSDSSESESSIKNKKVRSLYAIFRFCWVLSNIFFDFMYHNRQTQWEWKKIIVKQLHRSNTAQVSKRRIWFKQ